MNKKYAIIGDIHSNLEALNAVLDDAKAMGVTDYLCLGDVVGYNTNPAECIKIIRELGAPCVRGNHDHYASHSEESLSDFQPNAARVIEWTRQQLSEDDIRWLYDLPYIYKFPGVTLVHGTLDMPEGWGYVFDTVDAEANFAYQHTPICFHGHTHVPTIFVATGGHVTQITNPQPDVEVKLEIGCRYFVNVGSVGQPRDGNANSSYVIYDASERKFVFRRVGYPVEITWQKIREAGLPERLAQRILVGK